jgi:hypothetical protein
LAQDFGDLWMVVKFFQGTRPLAVDPEGIHSRVNIKYIRLAHFLPFYSEIAEEEGMPSTFHFQSDHRLSFSGSFRGDFSFSSPPLSRNSMWAW